ncbi:hypothetical protein DV733_00920 [Halapricum salinum]|uniref:Uncharacterized protein n=1 Tax=Halapricum salinum TaxID=1457250 RepID=A0A4D6H811_9EURY|nr:hypothetical protein DV733_00920 [Halapricum salinum]
MVRESFLSRYSRSLSKISSLTSFAQIELAQATHFQRDRGFALSVLQGRDRNRSIVAPLLPGRAQSCARHAS